jgi:hypothetical protein
MRLTSALLPILSLAALTAAYDDPYDEADGIYIRDVEAGPGRKSRVLAEAVQGGLNAALRNPQPSRFNNPSGPAFGSNMPNILHGSNPNPGSGSNGINGPDMYSAGSGMDSAPPSVAGRATKPDARRPPRSATWSRCFLRSLPQLHGRLEPPWSKRRMVTLCELGTAALLLDDKASVMAAPLFYSF